MSKIRSVAHRTHHRIHHKTHGVGKFNVLAGVASVICAVGILAGCGGSTPSPSSSSKPFSVVKLNDEAKGVVLLNKGEKATGCKSGGNVQKRQNSQGSKVDFATLKQSVINEVKNEAFHVVKHGNKVSLRILDEKASCIEAKEEKNKDGKGGAVASCVPEKIPGNQLVDAYEVKVEVLDCGTK